MSYRAISSYCFRAVAIAGGFALLALISGVEEVWSRTSAAEEASLFVALTHTGALRSCFATLALCLSVAGGGALFLHRRAPGVMLPLGLALVLLVALNLAALRSGAPDALRSATAFELALLAGVIAAVWLGSVDVVAVEVLAGWAGVALLGVVTSLAGPSVYHFAGHARWSAWFGNPNTYGCFAAVSLVAVAAHLSARRRDGRRLGGFDRLGVAVVGGASLAGVIFSYSRSAWLGCLLAFGLMFGGALVRAIRQLRHRLALAAVLLVAVIAGTQVPGVGGRMAATFQRDASVSNRLLTWWDGLGMAATQGWAGWGWAGWRSEFERHYFSGLASSSGSIGVNDFVTFAISFGFPATLAYLALVALLLRAAWGDPRARLFAAVVVAMLPTSFCNSVIFDRQIAVYWWWALAGAGVALARRGKTAATAGASAAASPPVATPLAGEIREAHAPCGCHG